MTAKMYHDKMDCNHGTEPSLFCCDCLEEESAVMAADFEKRLAAAVAERTEACAKIVEDADESKLDWRGKPVDSTLSDVAAAIRKLNEPQAPA